MKLQEDELLLKLVHEVRRLPQRLEFSSRHEHGGRGRIRRPIFSFMGRKACFETDKQHCF